MRTPKKLRTPLSFFVNIVFFLFISLSLFLFVRIISFSLYLFVNIVFFPLSLFISLFKLSFFLFISLFKLSFFLFISLFYLFFCTGDHRFRMHQIFHILQNYLLLAFEPCHLRFIQLFRSYHFQVCRIDILFTFD